MSDGSGDWTGRAECRYCSETFRPHPGFADHQDQCLLNPINRPHIIGHANAPGIDFSPPNTHRPEDDQ